MTVHDYIILELDSFFLQSKPHKMTTEQKALKLVQQWKAAREVLATVHPRSIEAASALAEIRAIERQVDEFQTGK